MTELKDSVMNENEIVELESVIVVDSGQVTSDTTSEDIQKEELSFPATRIEVIEQIERAIEREVSEVKGEIEQLKQHYYKLRMQEYEVARAEYETSQTEEEEKTPFVVPVDDLEERLKAAIQNYKEKKAKYLAEQEQQRQANLANIIKPTKRVC